MALKAGSIDDYAVSMASEMEKAFIAEWHKAMIGQEAPEALNNQMRLMFVAVAQGVVKHLQENHNAFEVTVNDNGSGNYTGTVTKIE